jgi:hypothetical protein
MSMKKCIRCNEWKFPLGFSRNAKSKDYLQNYCKPCARQYFKEYTEKRKADGVLVEVTSKVCAECNVEKPVSQFGKRTVSKDGLNSYCKPCWRNYLNRRKARLAKSA